MTAKFAGRSIGTNASDVTVGILKSIRDEVCNTNSRLDQTNARLDAMHTELSGRIESMHEELSRRIVESGVRTATAITDLAGSVREMTGVLRAANDLRPRLEKCETEVADLRGRLDRIERR